MQSKLIACGIVVEKVNCKVQRRYKQDGVRLVEIASECLIWTDPNLSSNIDTGLNVFILACVLRLHTRATKIIDIC